MKKLFFALSVVLISASAFAQSETDFERGYNEGKSTCHEAKEAWICRVPLSKIASCSFDEAVVSMGRSRAEAVLNNYCIRNSGSTEGLMCSKL